MNVSINRAGSTPRTAGVDASFPAGEIKPGAVATATPEIPTTLGMPALSGARGAPVLAQPRSSLGQENIGLDPALKMLMLQILTQGGNEAEATKAVTDNADKLRQDAAPARTDAIGKATQNFSSDFFAGVMNFVGAVSKNLDKIIPAVTSIATAVAAAVANPALIPNAVMTVASSGASVLLPMLDDMGVDLKTVLAEPVRVLAQWMGADEETARRIGATAGSSLIAIGNIALSIMDPVKFPFDAKLLGDASMDIAALIHPDRSAAQLQALGASVVSAVGPLVAAAGAAVGVYKTAASMMSGDTQSLVEQLPAIAVSIFKQSALGLDATAAGGSDADRLAGLLVGAFNNASFQNAFVALGNLYTELNAFSEDQLSGIQYKADDLQRYRPMQSFA